MIPFLEVDLGGRADFQIIIGIRFLAAHNLLVDCARSTLRFPDSLPYLRGWRSDIILPYQQIRPKRINLAS